MQLALIPPFAFLGKTFNTKYQLMLPHLADNEEYRRCYGAHCQNEDTYVILDNGVAEGEDFDWGRLLDVAYGFDVNEIVLPDIMQDGPGTVERAERFMDYFLNTSPEHKYQDLSDFKFMFVVQGKEYEEVLKTALWAAGQDWIHSIGIPRHLNTTLPFFTARSRIANDLTKERSFKDIHFLGGNPATPMELTSLVNPGITNQAYVRGMDTSMPFNYAFIRTWDKGYRMDEEKTPRHRPENYFEQPAEAFDINAVEHNIELMLAKIAAKGKRA